VKTSDNFTSRDPGEDRFQKIFPKICDFAITSFVERKNLFRDSLQHSGFSRCCEPILVMTWDILEEKFSREGFFAWK